jgi:hypothetical protein
VDSWYGYMLCTFEKRGVNNASTGSESHIEFWRNHEILLHIANPFLG